MATTTPNKEKKQKTKNQKLGRFNGAGKFE
jgi:hypothetical protein